MKVLTVVGNRPQFVKAAAVSKELRKLGSEYLVHTGQHYDQQLSEVFFKELGTPKPDCNLGISGGTNSSQVTRMKSELEPLLKQQQPDCVLVYGDTNSTLAAAQTADSLDLPVVHVEAGMRSFDRSMPEETNRIATDQLSSLLICSSQQAVDNLRAEQITSKAVVTGDVMVDVAQAVSELVRGRTELLTSLAVAPSEYYLATLHRAGNVDDPGNLTLAIDLLSNLPLTTVLPLHPRTAERLKQFDLIDRVNEAKQIKLVQPLGYFEFAELLHNAKAVLTDSGGVQKEAYLAKVKCVTLRDSTEWTETVEVGFNTLVGLDVKQAKTALEQALPSGHPQLYGDGKAGQRVAAAVKEFLQ